MIQENRLFLETRQWMLLLCFMCTWTLSDARNFVLNNPYPERDALEKIYYTSFSEQPKTLDPAKSYSSNEYQFIAQVYEPILQYDYLKRPYQLVPLTSSAMPAVKYLDALGHELPDPDRGKVASTVYTINILSGIQFQPHPAFAKDPKGNYRYFNLAADYLDDADIKQLSDFNYVGTRELKADDYIYQIKRLADPAVNSPIYGLMSTYILGFSDYGKTLPKQRGKNGYLDLRLYPLTGVRKLDDYTFEITVIGQYPQFMFWLAMPFFSPVPWEADRFYHEPDMDDRNFSFGWYPVGTGPFMLTENNPNRHMVLEKNPNYRAVYFPTQGTAEDEAAGYLQHKGERLPLIDKAIYILEKETIPRWNKFLQGYYDLSGVGTDSFDQAIQITDEGKAVLTSAMKNKGMHLVEMSDPTIYYLGFNMLDSLVGGHSDRARKLRRAISIAVNFNENIAIFFNGRGKPAQGPIAPGIFGFNSGIKGLNPYVFTWDGRAYQRRSIDDAKQLLKEAGYPGGVDKETGKPLILNYDVTATGGPDDKEQMNWMRKQFERIGISLNIRATLYNRFQEKIRSGNAQIFSWSWMADYPDPENFLFLLYGPNGKVKFGGENAANYSNPTYDRLFDLMKNRKNDERRQQLIDQMVDLLRFDAPWSFGINTESLLLRQQWVSKVKPNPMALNTLKYVAIDVPLRNSLRTAWNQPILWPVGLFFCVLILLLLPFYVAYKKNQRQRALRVLL